MSDRGANVRQQKLNVGPGVARMSDGRSYMSDRSANVGQKVTPAVKWPDHLNLRTEASGGQHSYTTFLNSGNEDLEACLRKVSIDAN